MKKVFLAFAVTLLSFFCIGNAYALEKTIKVVSPNGAETYYIGTTNKIKWTTLGGIDMVNIFLESENGSSATIATNVAASQNSYDWKINANSLSGKYKIMIVDSLTGNSTGSTMVIVDKSDNYFNIAVPSIQVLSPNGGETLTIGKTHNIKWKAKGIDKIDIGLNVGNATIVLAKNIPAKNGSFIWRIENNADFLNGKRIFIMDSANAVIENKITNDESDKDFTIVRPAGKIKVISPNGGETFTFGKTHSIKWNSTGIDKVDINLEFETGGGINIASNLSASLGNYSWLVNTVGATAKHKIIISESIPAGTAASNVYDKSDSFFKIVSPSLQVLSPNGGETLIAGKTYKVKWSSTGIDKINISLQCDVGGFNGIDIASKVKASLGSYTWKVNTDSLASCKVKISDPDNVNNSDISDNSFNIIRSSIKITSPNGGETLTVGNTYDIKWISAGVEKVNITLQYKDGNIAGSTTIAKNISAASSNVYSWKVKGIKTYKNYKIMVSDSNKSSTNDTSDDYFSIVSSSTAKTIKVILPNGGENLVIGNTYDIRWSSTGVDKVNISLQCITDGNVAKIISIANNVSASISSYAWAINNIDPLTKCTIRVLDASGADVGDASDDYFNILKITTAINGACGSANDTKVSVYPTSGLCSSGIICSIESLNNCNAEGLRHIISGFLANRINWTCMGINSGTDAKCAAVKG
ncbi:MAG: Ser-Thr-rich GPI-anchored membrane family protein [Candidatus Paceibacterota bacterium]